MSYKVYRMHVGAISVFFAGCLQAVFAAVTVGNLVDFQVLQRTAPASADVALAGTCKALAGSYIQARVSDQATGVAIDHFDWATVGAAVLSTTWKGLLRGLPVGGEYLIQFRQFFNGYVVDNSVTAIGHILIGDVWGAAGQSNMQGCGRLDLSEPPIAQVHVVSLDKGWAKAVEPISGWGCGPAFPFALSVYRATGIPIGLAYYARGSTSMDFWQKDSLGFQNWTSVIKKAGGFLKGVIWYQGESNSTNIEKAKRYKTMTQAFMADIRAYVKNDSLPWILGQIATAYDGNNYDTGMMIVREAQREIGLEDRFAESITTIDQPRSDQYHFDTPQYQTIGGRFAAAALTKGYGKPQPEGPRFFSAFFLDSSRTTVRIRCSKVRGKLDFSTGADWLFAAQNTKVLYPLTSSVYDVSSFIAHFDQALCADAVVGFGYGQNPTACALSDSSAIPLQPFYNQSIAMSGDSSHATTPENNQTALIARQAGAPMELRITLNPFGMYAMVAVRFPSIKNTSGLLSLYTIGGIPVWSMPLITGQYRCTISRRFLPPGCYIVRVSDGKTQGTARIFWKFRKG